MITVLSLMWLGFFLGMRHATDPDHVIAVSTIATRQPTMRNAVLVGAVWGIGHTLTIVGVGGAIILFSIVVPPRLGLTMETAAALMLVVLGLWNLTGVLQRIRETSLSGDGRAGGRPPAQGSQTWLDRRLGRRGLYRMLRPLGVGLVHGLAGSAAVALLVLATIQDPGWAMVYLVLFGIGTIIGMMLITVAIAAPLSYASKRFSRIDRPLRVASGLLSLGFGLFLVYHMVFVDGLLTGRPGPMPE